VRQFTGGGVRLPNLDALVGFPGNQAGARQVKLQRVNAVLGLLERPRLHLGAFLLEAVARCVVPKVHRPVVAARHEHPVVLGRHRVDHGVVARQLLQEATILALPLAQAVGPGRHKGALLQCRGGVTQAPHGLLVVREGGKALAGRQIPQLDRLVVGAGNDLGVRRGGQDGTDSVFVPGQHVQLRLGAHVPDPRHGVAAGGDENVEGGVQLEGVHSGKVSVVVSHYLICFQIPAFDRLVFGCAEQVGMSFTKGQGSDGTNMARQSQLKSVFGAGTGFG